MVFILISNKKKDWNEFVFKTLENLIEYNNSHKNLCNIMLTGGDTANNLYRNWKNNFSKIKKNLNIFFTDERCISKESHLSNYYNLVSNLYIKIPSHHKILPIYNEDLSINENIKNYELLLPNFIDITVITLGSGGHIASIFSKSDSNLKNKNLIYVNAPIKPHKRLSISISYINKSKKILLLVKGIEILSSRMVITRTHKDGSVILFTDAYLSKIYSKSKINKGKANKIEFFPSKDLILMEGEAEFFEDNMKIMSDEIHYDLHEDRILKSVNAKIINNL